MNFTDLIEKRYSCRKFSDREVEKELLEKIVDAGIKAPTAVNKQPVKIFLMNSETAQQNIKKVTNHTFGAKNFFVVASKPDVAWVREFDEKNFADVDASIVATHMMLAITDLGLESTWVGHFNAPLLKEIYPEMKDYNLIAIFPVGYRAEDGKPSERHFIRKEKSELFEII